MKDKNKYFYTLPFLLMVVFVCTSSGCIRVSSGSIRDYRDIAIEIICKKISNSLDMYLDEYPHVGGSTFRSAYPNELWTSGFYIGEVYLSYEVEQNRSYLKNVNRYLDSFADRLNDPARCSTHDLGFLYTTACVNLFNSTGNERAKELALKAADILAGRFNSIGGYIQAWGTFNQGNPYVYMIVDTMMNLPLLYWASKITGEARYSEIANTHAKTTMKYLVRDDYSTYHTYLMNPETGEAIRGKTEQGFSDESTWARGQAWAVYGFALAYKYTGNKDFLITAKGCADYYINNLPANCVPYWDFTFSDNNADIKDTSAASILACGLIELAFFDDELENYYDLAIKIVDSLYENHFIKDECVVWLLNDGMYHREEGNVSTIWGDYFFYIAICKLENLRITVEPI